MLLYQLAYHSDPAISPGHITGGEGNEPFGPVVRAGKKDAVLSNSVQKVSLASRIGKIDVPV